MHLLDLSKRARDRAKRESIVEYIALTLLMAVMVFILFWIVPVMAGY